MMDILQLVLPNSLQQNKPLIKPFLSMYKFINSNFNILNVSSIWPLLIKISLIFSCSIEISFFIPPIGVYTACAVSITSFLQMVAV